MNKKIRHELTDRWQATLSKYEELEDKEWGDAFQKADPNSYDGTDKLSSTCERKPG